MKQEFEMVELEPYVAIHELTKLQERGAIIVDVFWDERIISYSRDGDTKKKYVYIVFRNQKQTIE